MVTCRWCCNQPGNRCQCTGYRCRSWKRLSELTSNYPTGLKTTCVWYHTIYSNFRLKVFSYTHWSCGLGIYRDVPVLTELARNDYSNIAVPVVGIGYFCCDQLIFSVSQSTPSPCFAMVLAIGLLVDDAIVVVENVERVMQEEHLNLCLRLKKSMRSDFGAMGITSVLTAVFVPMAFFVEQLG